MERWTLTFPVEVDGLALAIAHWYRPRVSSSAENDDGNGSSRFASLSLMHISLVSLSGCEAIVCRVEPKINYCEWISEAARAWRVKGTSVPETS